jgi:hypothetical protein
MHMRNTARFRAEEHIGSQILAIILHKLYRRVVDLCVLVFTVHCLLGRSRACFSSDDQLNIGELLKPVFFSQLNYLRI